jgi:hypothetical protein
MGLLAITLGAVGLMALYFGALPAPRPHPALAILPGLAIATFAGAWLAYWGRVRGGSLEIEAARNRIVLADPRTREELVDRTVPYGAWLVRDPKSGHRVLILSQAHEPVMLYDLAGSAPPSGAWEKRHVALDLGAVALSPSSAHVYTLAKGASLDPLLTELSSDVKDEAAPFLEYRLPSGEVLRVGASGMRAGDRAVPLHGGDVAARRIAVQSPQGDLVGLSVMAGETSFLLACQDPGDTLDAASASDAPDAYLPAAIWSALATVYGVPIGDTGAIQRSYRG